MYRNELIPFMNRKLLKDSHLRAILDLALGDDTSKELADHPHAFLVWLICILPYNNFIL